MRRFREYQPTPMWALVVLALTTIGTAVAVWVVVERTRVISGLTIFGVLLLAFLWTLALGMLTTVTDDRLVVRIGLLRKRVDRNTVISAEPIDYRRGRDSGGWPVGFSVQYGQVWAMRSGRAVHILLDSEELPGAALLVGSRRPDELAEALLA